MEKRTFWIWTNSKRQGESGYIEHTVLGQYKTTYTSVYGGDYRDYFKSLCGAKSSLTRYVGYKTEWEMETKS